MGVKLPAFELILFYLFPHLKLEGKRDFSSLFGFLFCLRDVCNSRSFSDLIVPSVKSVFNGQNSLRYLGPLIWNSIPIETRSRRGLENSQLQY